ncbi:MAG: hypothetical protein HDR19_01100 [Lachnospiraceae bacterium]|nr:hypothetical protein [Lachnospiraceae bacterium]
MDNFIDKLAQKFSAQEIIKANAQAEAEEMKKLQLQVAEYERILQEIRRLNYKNTELSEQLETRISENTDKIQAMKEDEQKLVATLRDITEEQTRNREADLEKREAERIEKEKDTESEMAALTALLEEKFKSSDDFVHKENVKVYRNVQAVVVDELKKSLQSVRAGDEDIKNMLGMFTHNVEKNLSKKINAVMVISIISLIASLSGVALCVLQLLMRWGIIK